MNIEKFIDGLGDWLAVQLKPLAARLKAIEDRPAARDGVDGKDGASAEPDYNVVDERIKAAIESLKTATDETYLQRAAEFTQATGEILIRLKNVEERPLPVDGKDGASAEPDYNVVDERIQSAIREVEAKFSLKESQQAELHTSLTERVKSLEDRPAPVIPEPVNYDIVDERIKSAIDGIPAPKEVSLDEVRALVTESVTRAAEAIRVPADGRDALDLVILPEIDATRVHPRGTYARHLGGLWRSFETTAGLKGWECIVNGVQAIEYEQSEDGRVIGFCAKMSDGSAARTAVSIPAMVYRGIWTDGEFAHGDTVTFGGSLWHCDEPTRDKPGAPGSKGWTLAAKKGRDGKDTVSVVHHTGGVKL